MQNKSEGKTDLELVDDEGLLGPADEGGAGLLGPLPARVDKGVLVVRDC